MGDSVKDDDGNSAARRTFAIPELCEHIFSQVPLRDLLTHMPRVCKEWKAVIDGSSKLQRGLFFKPTGPVLCPVSPNDPEYPLFRDETGQSDHRIILENPFYRPLAQGTLSRNQAQLMRRPEASWRRMYITQPPVQWIRAHQTKYDFNYYDCKVVRDASGISMGDPALKHPKYQDLRMALYTDGWRVPASAQDVANGVGRLNDVELYHAGLRKRWERVVIC